MAGRQVDYDLVRDSTKGLTVTFILLITCFNLVLLFRVFRCEGSLRSPRRYMIAFLAFGDILFALYSIVIEAKAIFDLESLSRVSICTIRLSQVYGQYFGFVFGIALCCLCLEITMRKTLRDLAANVHPILTSAVLCSAPWLLGLIVMLPLALAGPNSDKCTINAGKTFDRARAYVTVGTLVPGALAILFYIVMSLRKPAPLPDDYSVEENQNQQPQQYYGMGQQQMPFPPGSGGYTVAPQQAYPNYYNQPAVGNHALPSHPQQYTIDNKAESSLAPLTGSAHVNYPTTQPPPPAFNTAYPTTQPPPPAYNITYPTTQPTTPPTSAESSQLLMVIIAYVVFTFPLAFFMLSRLRLDPPHLEADVEIGLTMFFTWFSRLRALAWPVIWRR